MTTQEIYKMANELTEAESNNIIGGWKRDNELEQIKLVEMLMQLGDSLQMAVATTIAEKYNSVGVSEIYNIAYN